MLSCLSSGSFVIGADSSFLIVTGSSFLIVTGFLLCHTQKHCQVFDFFFFFFVKSVCFFKSLANGEYSNFLVLAVFSNKSFSGKISFPVKNSCSPTFSDDEAEILAVFLSRLY